MSEITPELIEEYQRQQAKAENDRRLALIQEIVNIARQAGYTIIAEPRISEDGRLVAAWGVAKS